MQILFLTETICQIHITFVLDIIPTVLDCKLVKRNRVNTCGIAIFIPSSFNNKYPLRMIKH